ncbi:MAG: hypothetical protein WA160_14595 [Pseudobdellovibrio sp.]
MLKKTYVPKILSIFLFTAAFGGYSHAQETDVSVDSQSEVESLKANLDDSQGGLELSTKELKQAKLDRTYKIKENNETAARIRKQIQYLSHQQITNTKETARLAGQIIQLNKDIKTNEANEVKALTQAEKVRIKLADIKKLHDQSVVRKDKSISDLKLTNAEIQKNQETLKLMQVELKSARSQEALAGSNLIKAEASLAKFKLFLESESIKIEKQTKQALAKADEYDKKTKLVVEHRTQMQERLKLKRQRLSDAKDKQKKAAARLASAATN